MDLRLLTFVVVVATVQCGSAQYTAPKCNPKVVAGIEKYWAKFGKPTEFFAKTGQVWKVERNTDSGVYGDASCVTYTPLGDGKVSVSIDCKVFNNITISLKDGFLTVSGDKDLHYLVRSSEDMVAVYRCNTGGPPESATVQPDAAVLTTPAALRVNVVRMVSFFKRWGLQLTKSFNCLPSFGN